ncbi:MULTISPECIES: hypothetical protein [Microbacterium]|uniref:hypothetical protein n=1 Tax=Microbacterium TaxID=33882 RepID=UPI001D1758B6|nr:hypothetical protein [Microbacterium testaceum]MCC4248314.1 hypothetical protein [Microbacterium testaceum]
MTVRSILSGIALAFTAYLSARSLLWTLPDTVERGWLLIAALVLYLPITWLWILLPTRRRSAGTDEAREGMRLTPPRWAVGLALMAAAVVPNAAFAAVSEAGRSQPFVTWVIGGIGALMTVVMVRRRPAVAWTGTGLLAVSTAVWLGPLSALSLGLVGSLVWVAAAQLITIALDRVARDAEQLSELQQAASAWQASQSGRQRERRLHVQRALHVAGPVLGRTIETGGNLRPSEKSAARLAEQSLRDELRSPRLLDDGVRAQIDAARRRGTIVMLFDEGGLDGLPASALQSIRAELAGIVAGAASERLIIRTSPHHEVAVTVVGRTATVGAGADEDDVDLWREIRRPR